MNGHQIKMILWFSMFILTVWISFGYLMVNIVFGSFVFMLLAIYILFSLYNLLSDSLEESLEASQ